MKHYNVIIYMFIIFGACTAIWGIIMTIAMILGHADLANLGRVFK